MLYEGAGKIHGTTTSLSLHPLYRGLYSCITHLLCPAVHRLWWYFYHCLYTLPSIIGIYSQESLLRAFIIRRIVLHLMLLKLKTRCVNGWGWVSNPVAFLMKTRKTSVDLSRPSLRHCHQNCTFYQMHPLLWYSDFHLLERKKWFSHQIFKGKSLNLCIQL